MSFQKNECQSRQSEKCSEMANLNTGGASERRIWNVQKD